MRAALLASAALALAPAAAQAQVPLPLPSPTATATSGPSDPGGPPPPVVAPPGPGTEAVAQGQDAARSGASGVDTLRPPLGLRWSVTFTGNVASAPLIADGRVYVTHVDGEQYVIEALDARSGARLWSAPLVSERFTAPVAAFGAGAVFVFSGGRLTAFDAATGARRWDMDASAGGRGTPVVAGDLVLLPGSGLTAFAVADGAVRWQQAIQGGDPAVSGDRVYTSNGCEDYALDRRAGNVLWTRNETDCSGGSGDGATAFGDRVSYPSADPEPGVRAAADGAPQPGVGLAVVSGDTGIASDRSGLTAVDLATGRQLWRPGEGLPLGLPGTLVRALDDPSLRHVVMNDLRTGRRLWELALPVPFETDILRPVAGAGVLVIANGPDLHAFAGGTGIVQATLGRRKPVFTRSGRQVTVAGRVGERLWPTRATLQAAPPGGRFRTVRRGAVTSGRFSLTFRPDRNVRVRAIAPGLQPSASRRVFAYPAIGVKVRQVSGLVRVNVSVRAVPGVRFGGRRVVQYIGHDGRLRRLGSTLLSSGRRGTITFPPLSNVTRRDSIYTCLVGAPRLGLGAPDALARGCGAAHVRF